MPESSLGDATTQSSGPLRSPAAVPLPLGQLRPVGWLARQLRLQADGMAGHLDQVWPDVADSAWIGGSADGWERGPYWLDGLVPLAYLLDDDRLRGTVRRWVDEILQRQDTDGWLGPRSGNPGLRLEDQGELDVWPRMLVLKALLQHRSATGDERIVPATVGFAEYLVTLLAGWPLRDWGRFRWAELARSLQELYEVTGQGWLLELAETAYAQGYRWQAFADRFPYPEKRSRERLLAFEHSDGGPLPHDGFLASHGVNVAMGLKEFPVRWRQQSSDDLRASLTRMLAELDAHHGQATGVFSADEHLAGPHPSQGTETCAVVELLDSLAVAIETWGPSEDLVDRWERVAYNALPAAATADECAHQYDQQANQGRLSGNRGPGLYEQRPRREHLRVPAALRLLHREPTPGLAEVRGPRLDGDPRRRAAGVVLCPGLLSSRVTPASPPVVEGGRSWLGASRKITRACRSAWVRVSVNRSPRIRLRCRCGRGG